MLSLYFYDFLKSCHINNLKLLVNCNTRTYTDLLIKIYLVYFGTKYITIMNILNILGIYDFQKCSYSPSTLIKAYQAVIDDLMVFQCSEQLENATYLLKHSDIGG